MVKLIVPILLIGLCLVSDLYIYHRYISNTSMWRWLWWLPMLLLVCFFAKFLFFNQGFIAEYNTTNLFLLLMMLTCVPKILFSILSLIPKVGPYLGIAAAIGIVYIVKFELRGRIGRRRWPLKFLRIVYAVFLFRDFSEVKLYKSGGTVLEPLNHGKVFSSCLRVCTHPDEAPVCKVFHGFPG